MRPWYEKSFGSEYLKLYAHRDVAEARASIHSIVKLLSLGKDEPVLDLCCGAGRHLLALHEKGFGPLVGLDLSRELLQAATRKLTERNGNEHAHNQVRLIQADMRSIPCENYFAVILSFFTSFGYFDEDEENQMVLNAAHRSLRPKGRFLIDYLNQEQVISHLVAKDEKILPHRRVQNIRCLTDDCRRVEKRTTIVTDAGTRHEFHESVRLYSADEMKNMLHAAGFVNVRKYGSLEGEEFAPESERLIMIAQKENNDDQN